MAENEKIIELPFWETVRRSFLYVLTNMDVYLKTTALGFAILIYEMFTGFPSLCNIRPNGCSGGWQQNVSLFLLTIASIAIVIAFIRHIVLKVPNGYFSLAFGKREAVYFIYNIMFIAIITLPSVLVIFLMALVGQSLGLADGFFSLAIIVPVALTIYFSRLFLVFPAIAVDNKELRFKESFELTKGNANKIFWGQFIMMVPAALLLIILSLLFKLINSDLYVVKLVFVALIYALSFLDSCFKASFYSHIYQYFIYFKDKIEVKK